MDNFMDKLAQKLNAQEMIKANSAAEAAQLNKMQSQISEYDAALQEIKKLGLKNAEATDKLNQLMAESAKKIDELTKESIAKIEAIQVKDDSNAEIKAQLKELSEALNTNKKEAADAFENNKKELAGALDATKQEMEELFKKTEEYVHTEDVKVYRNVQAVVVEENAKQTETFVNTQGGTGKKVTALLVINILIFIGVMADLGIRIAQLLKLF